jgi:hypothetical protein
LVVPYSAKTYAFCTHSTAYKKQGALDQWSLTQQKFMLFTCVAPHTKSKGLQIGGPLLTHQKFIFFTHVAPRTKSKGLPISGPLLRKIYVFYMCSITYKKQGVLNRRSLTQQKLMLSTRVAPRTKSKGAPDRRSTHLLLLLAHISPRTKSKGLHMYVLQIYYFIN